MSIDFYIAEERDGIICHAYRCDCLERWHADYLRAEQGDRESPDIYSCESCTTTCMNLANANAIDLLRWLGISQESDYMGHMSAKAMAVLCRRRLWPEARNNDPAIPSQEVKTGGARLIIAGRGDGYLRGRTAQLLEICEKAGDRLIAWA